MKIPAILFAVLLIAYSGASAQVARICDLPIDSTSPPPPTDRLEVSLNCGGSRQVLLSTLLSGVVPLTRAVSCAAPLLCNSSTSTTLATPLALTYSSGWPYYDVRTYGAVGDGSADDTAAVVATLAAIPSTGGIVWFPAGTYKLTSGVTISKPVTLLGAGPQTSFLLTTSTTLDVLTISANNVSVFGLGFKATGITRTAGAYIKAPAGNNGLIVSNFSMIGHWIGIESGQDAATRIEMGSIRSGAQGTGSAGIHITAGNDTYIREITMDAGATHQQDAGIWVSQTGSLNITDVDIIHSTCDLKIDGGYSIYVENSFFDTAVHGICLSPASDIQRSHFIGTWTCSHSGSGVYITSGAGNVGSIDFIGHTSCLNGGDGVQVAGAVTGLNFIGGVFSGNTGNGFTLLGTLSNWGIENVRVGPSGTMGANANGIVMQSGAGTQYRVIGNDLTGNTTANLSNSMSGAGIIRSNIPVAVNPVIPGSELAAHSTLTGLSSDDHTQYTLLAGRSGGQTLTGGTGASDGLTIIPTSNATKGKLTVSNNAAALQAASGTGVIAHFGNTDSTTTSLEIDAYAGAPLIFFRRSGGTAASPSAISVNNVIGGFQDWARGTTAYSSAQRAAVQCLAAESWSDTAQGTTCAVQTTSVGTTSTRTVWQVDAAGHQSSGGTAPTVACTGTGTSPAAPTISGTDSEFTVTMSTGTSPSSSGTCTVTFATAFGATVIPVCMLASGASSWGAESTLILTTDSLSAPVLSWTNVSALALANLTASTSYKMKCIVRGS